MFLENKILSWNTSIAYREIVKIIYWKNTSNTSSQGHVPWIPSWSGTFMMTYTQVPSLSCTHVCTYMLIVMYPSVHPTSFVDPCGYTYTWVWVCMYTHGYMTMGVLWCTSSWMYLTTSVFKVHNFEDLVYTYTLIVMFPCVYIHTHCHVPMFIHTHSLSCSHVYAYTLIVMFPCVCIHTHCHVPMCMHTPIVMYSFVYTCCTL